MNEEPKMDEEAPLLPPGGTVPYSSSREDDFDKDNSPNATGALDSGNFRPPTSVRFGLSTRPASVYTHDAKKKKGNKMNFDSTLAMEMRIQRSMLMHLLAAEHFTFRQFWIFEVTQGFFTMVSSILAFVATTELVPEHTKIILTTIVGSTAILVGFFQGMNGLCAYGTRAVMHEAVALDLRDIRSNLRLLRCKLGYIDTTDDDDSISIGEDEQEGYLDTFESISDKFEQSLFGCKSPVPIQISAAFEGVNSSRYASQSKANLEHLQQIYGENYNYEWLTFKSFDVLSEEIMDYPFFPLWLPRASHTIERALKRIVRVYKRDQDMYCKTV